MCALELVRLKLFKVFSEREPKGSKPLKVKTKAQDQDSKWKVVLKQV